LHNEATPKQHMMPRRPIFDTYYVLTDEDISVEYFLRSSYEDAEIVQVGQFGVTVRLLRPNVTKGFTYDQVSRFHSHHVPLQIIPYIFVLQVINAYVYISNVEIDTTSVLTTFDVMKLTVKSIPQGCQLP
jgi:hypothetical protein